MTSLETVADPDKSVAECLALLVGPDITPTKLALHKQNFLLFAALLAESVNRSNVYWERTKAVLKRYGEVNGFSDLTEHVSRDLATLRDLEEKYSAACTDRHSALEQIRSIAKDSSVWSTNASIELLEESESVYLTKAYLRALRSFEEVINAKEKPLNLYSVEHSVWKRCRFLDCQRVLLKLETSGRETFTEGIQRCLRGYSALEKLLRAFETEASVEARKQETANCTPETMAKSGAESIPKEVANQEQEIQKLRVQVQKLQEELKKSKTQTAVLERQDSIELEEISDPRRTNEVARRFSDLFQRTHSLCEQAMKPLGNQYDEITWARTIMILLKVLAKKSKDQLIEVGRRIVGSTDLCGTVNHQVARANKILINCALPVCRIASDQATKSHHSSVFEKVTGELKNQTWFEQEHSDVKKAVNEFLRWCVPVFWDIALQKQPLFIDSEPRVFDPVRHTRGHDSDMKSSNVKYYLWPCLLVEATQKVLVTGKVVTG